jgi:hypothetical protein
MPEQEELTTGIFSSAQPTGNQAAQPQFATAEYAHIPGTERCKICGNLVSGEYYRIHDLMACQTCALQARAGQPADSHVAFTRGLLFGIGGAILGLIGYAVFEIVTGWMIGYLALGVGWLVAKAISKGSHGLGGRRYQIAAVLLTYLAISFSSIPIAIAQIAKSAKAHALQTAPAATVNGSDQAAGKSQPSSAPVRAGRSVNLGKAVLGLLFLGVASPFLALAQPASGAIGLFILFIGLRIAWQLTGAKALAVDGPYPVGA